MPFSITEPGEEIGRRVFTLKIGDAPPIEVTVRFGKPMSPSNAESFYCPYEISDHRGTRIKRVFGCDAIQSIQLALKMADAELRGRAEAEGGEIRWAGGPGLGL